MKHYVNVNDIYKNNNCFKYLLYMQHSKEIKKLQIWSVFSRCLWPSEEDKTADVNETTKLQYEHVKLWVSKKKHL